MSRRTIVTATGRARVFTSDDIYQALEPTHIPGVYALTQTIYVMEEDWRKCLVEIGKLCCVRWFHHYYNKNHIEPEDRLVRQAKRTNDFESYFYRQHLICHRRVHAAHHRKKKHDYHCNAQIVITGYYRHPAIIELRPHNKHTTHTPGVDDEFPGDHKTLYKRMDLFLFLNEQERTELIESNHPNMQDIIFYLSQFNLLTKKKRKRDELEAHVTETVNSEVIARIDGYLMDNKATFPRRAKLDMLNYLNQHGRPFERRFPCRDRDRKIQKIAKKLYLFQEDERESMLIWYSDHLMPDDYLIYDQDVYDEDTFVSGFVSPLQQDCLRTCMKVCLVATPGLGKEGDVTLYSLIIYEQGRIYPACYMFTNTPCVQSVYQWMEYLKENTLLETVEEIVFDCELTEWEERESREEDMSRLQSLFPKCNLSYCTSHLLHDLTHLLSHKVRLNGADPGSEIHLESMELRGNMMTRLRTLIEERDKDQWRRMMADFEETYANQSKFMRHFKSWYHNRLWTQAHCPFPLANQDIAESINIWRTHLNSLYLNRCPDKRIDRMICILTISTKEQLGEEAEREIDQIQSLAVKISAMEREQMIHQKEDDPGRWIVMSLQEEDIGYELTVKESNKQIVSCQCYYATQHEQPCEHVYLFQLEHPEYNYTVTRSLTSGSDYQTHSIDDILSVISDIVDVHSTLNHRKHDLIRMAESITPDELKSLHKKCKSYLHAFETLTSKYE